MELEGWFQLFPEYKDNDFYLVRSAAQRPQAQRLHSPTRATLYMGRGCSAAQLLVVLAVGAQTGESYAGLLLPNLMNQIATKPNAINLKAAAIGNGCHNQPQPLARPPAEAAADLVLATAAALELPGNQLRTRVPVTSAAASTLSTMSTSSTDTVSPFSHIRSHASSLRFSCGGGDRDDRGALSRDACDKGLQEDLQRLCLRLRPDPRSMPQLLKGRRRRGLPESEQPTCSHRNLRTSWARCLATLPLTLSARLSARWTRSASTTSTISTTRATPPSLPPAPL